uniref:Aminotransferase-like plant mobile domain-containing protein n=1 Tax=Ananas comosus var. bracteatus TaxID=296719 RepID=A0A6V7NTG0_ANACO|nr:unnamed protein product [Ananas comosus var. bracteatus]
MANFTQGYFLDVGSDNVVLLEPTGNTSGAEDVHCLGLCILQGRPSWRGLRILGDGTVLNGLTEWKNDIIRQFKTTLCSADILGGIIAFRGKYELDLRIFKGLVEAWCSESNTFHFPYGEIGISLWDIRVLGGIPILGEMYEEFIPRNCDLDIYSASLTSLLTVYEWLTIRNQRGPVYYNHWIDYWYRGDIASSSRPRLISNDEHCIGPPIRDNGYRAAFLSLWLCKFIMPSGQRDTIRPEVFVIASKLGEGLKVALAPAVLCSIQVALDRDHNPLIDAKTIVANPQGIASPREIEDSIPSRYNPEVDYETTPSVSKHDSDSPQDTWVVEEDVSDTNMVVSAHTLIGNESKDNIDDTATTRYLEIKSVNGDDPIAIVGGSRPTLIDHLIEIVRTSNYHSYPAVQEKVIEYCEILSRIGVEISGLSSRLQKLFKEAEAIREVAAHPSYSLSARILKGHTSRITKELKDYDSKRSSLTRTKEKALTLLDQQCQRVEDLKTTLAAARAKKAELNDEVNTINECISRLDSGKDKAVAMMEGAVEEFGATEGSHSMTVEFNHLSNLIRNFEHHCKEFDL